MRERIIVKALKFISFLFLSASFMPCKYAFLCIILPISFSFCSSEQKDEDCVVIEEVKARVFLADPFIMLHEDVYYAYGTKEDDGIVVYTSNDLKEWKVVGLALHKNNSYGEVYFWAPEVYYVNGKFYMYYSAEEHICVAIADSPLGSFSQPSQKAMIEDENAIDNSLFIDDDGKPYLFFDRFNDGLNIWVAELEDDLMTIKTETLHPCIHVS